ncbi:MAG: tetratricopeptide repeat protein [Acidobacteriales bacterium]|nr:tetratricopeptide repeat protein [Terriglobales bacterium]
MAAVPLSLALCSNPSAQAAPAVSTDSRADAYYNYAMGHLYAELAGAFGNRSEYVNKAIDHLKEAIKADPGTRFLSDELSDLYLQSGKIQLAVTEAQDRLKRDPDDVDARRLLGRIYTRMIGDVRTKSINQNMLKQAIEQFEKIGEKDPKDLDCWLMLGRLQKIGQNSLASEKAYKKVLELDPDNEDALTGLAMVYSDLGDTKSASEMLRRVTDKNPTLRTLTALATTYEQMREYPLAAETLRRALKMAPDNFEIRRALAQNLMLSEQVDESLKIYQELAKADPQDVQVQLRLSQLYRQQRNFDKAREASQRARKLEPDNLEIRYNDVNLMDAEGKTAEAITELKGILDATARKEYEPPERSNRVIFLERLGLLYRSADQPEKAAESFRAIGQLDPDQGARSAAQVIETYRLAKMYAKAEQEAEAAHVKYPQDRMVTLIRASVLADSGKVEKAAAELKTLLTGKDDRDTYMALAQVWDKAKNYGEMAKALDSAEKFSKTNEEKESVTFMRGAMLERMKKFAESEAEFKKVIGLNPKNASALNYLGYMLADRNVRLQEAYSLIAKALDLEPQNGAFLDSMGWVYFRMGKLADAETYLLRALEKVVHDPAIHDHLGDVYSKQGKLKEAIAQWQNSVKAWESSAPSDMDHNEIAKVTKKLEGAKVRLAKEAHESGIKQR